ncbi:zinc-ribbon domain-containing protein [Olsenella uli]|uniref:zinc-ribbon domain-containing protein n=1 Tax=Olsenella uli TaxID=133926 RepID=UPI003D7BCE58
MYCNNCGAELDGDALFCTQCGAPVDRGGQEVSAAEPAPATEETLATGTVPAPQTTPAPQPAPSTQLAHAAGEPSPAGKRPRTAKKVAMAAALSVLLAAGGGAGYYFGVYAPSSAPPLSKRPGTPPTRATRSRFASCPPAGTPPRAPRSCRST